jgi:hypothetical protein
VHHRKGVVQLLIHYLLSLLYAENVKNKGIIV